MQPPVFLADRAALGSDVVLLSGAEGRHAATVRRLRPGERADVTDGAGLMTECVVAGPAEGGLELIVQARREVPRPDPAITVVRQEIQLLLFHNPVPEPDQHPGFLARTGFNHICFRVEDLDATLSAFASIGHQPRNEVLNFHDRRLVFLDGPAGVVIELAEWTSVPSVGRILG